MGCLASAHGCVTPPSPGPGNGRGSEGGGGGTACVGNAVSCRGLPCNGSPEAIGDLINYNDKQVQITEMNSLWLSNTDYGRLYQGGDGNRYVQLNYADQTGKSLGGSFFGIGAVLNSPGGYSGIQRWDGSLPPGTQVQRCETKGGILA